MPTTVKIKIEDNSELRTKMKNILLKKSITYIVIMSFITLLIPTTSNAEESLSKEIIPAEMKEIDFSKEIPQEQQDLLKDYYLKDSQDIFNSNYAKQILKQDQLKIKEYMESNTIKKSNNYVKQDLDCQH